MTAEPTAPNPLRWGILSAAQIARKNWLAIRNTGLATVTAVASRDADRARRFIDECQAEAPMPSVPRAFGSYAELIDSPDVDAVYLPLPTGHRREWVLRAAAAGKHVVCEKPCAPNLEALREMVGACERAGVQFMDGVMFMHSRRLAALREALDTEATVGRIRRIDSAFSFCGDDAFFAENIRMQPHLEPHGCLGDLGWYNIRFALWAMKEEMPTSVTGRLLSTRTRRGDPSPVPTEFSGELRFADGASSGFYCSFLTENQQWAVIGGESGSLRLEDFVLPFDGDKLRFEVIQPVYDVRGCDFRMHSNARSFEVEEASQGDPTAQETRLFRDFTEQVRSGSLNPDWPRQALNTQRVMEACLESAKLDGRLMAPR
ncbi:MAG: Gfo/Idh/MocA family oxidoreductase [Verrucomicrobiales bacterium]|nr:Gfo/Idh/MocA family oxidoreductase [Verrucomicrobiales bacterium]MCP5525485.1 Gfo/Idh/MocA family oxidoreductase [Verrucomicrobiales bacterium]